jgi:hypothetical protein
MLPLAALLAVFQVPTATTVLPPLDVDNATQPFLHNNDGLLASMTEGVRRVLNAPSFDTVVLQAAHLPLAPWEAGFTVEALGTSVVTNPATGALRMYYSLRWAALNSAGVPVSHADPGPGMYLTAFADSTDGVNWSKPALDSLPFSSALSGVNASASNVLLTSIGSTATVWVEPNAPAESRWRAVADPVVISYSADGITWARHKSISLPTFHGMGGTDSQPIIFADPGCNCHALVTRIWSTGKYHNRMVRRADILSLDNKSSVGRQRVVIKADSIDLAAHRSAISSFTPVSYYGATAWVREYGGQRAYFMLPVRFWHWQGWRNQPPARKGEGGDPATYDIPLAYSRDGFNFTFLGGRQPFARPTTTGTIGVSRLWLAPPIIRGEEELFFLTRGNMNEDGQVANSTDGTACHRPGADCIFRSEVALGRLRLNGAVSLDSAYGQPSNVTTVPLLFSCDATRIVLNVDASGGGSVVVELRAANGN